MNEPFRWRNQWRAIERIGPEINKGDIISVRHEYPSRCLADKYAKRDLDEMFARFGISGTYSHLLEYAGAFVVPPLPAQPEAKEG